MFNIRLLDKYAIIISSLVIPSGNPAWTHGIGVISEAYSVCVSKCGRKRYWGCLQGVISASSASDWCHFLSVPPITESGASGSLAVMESRYVWETLMESSSQKNNPARLHSSDSNLGIAGKSIFFERFFSIWHLNVCMYVNWMHHCSISTFLEKCCDVCATIFSWWWTIAMKMNII